MKVLKVSISIFLAIVLNLSHATASTESQTLLDNLANAKTLEQAEPIISDLWEIWISSHGDENEKVLMEQGVLALKQGNLEHAEKLFGDIISQNPSFTEAWNKRATVRYMMSKFQESQSDVFEVLQREPRHFGAISGLGMINLRLGNLNAALNAYKNLQRIFPASPEAKQYISILREKLNLMDL